jgi:tetratricopeptide (TPR) repeat protein
MIEMGMPLKGNTSEISLPKILAFLNRHRKTGTLLLRTPAFTKKVYLLKGDAIFASSTYEDDRLGEMLVKAGKITMEQYDESVRLLKKKTGKRQGAILVELGYITPKDLFWGVKYQVREIIYSMFLIEGADYEFIEGEIPENEVITLKLSMGNLIYDGVKRIDNLTRIRSELPGTDAVLGLSSDPVSLFQDVELAPQDRKLLSAIDGVKTVKEVIHSAWISSFEGMKVLYVLWSIGVIEEKKKAVQKAEEIEETVSLEEILQPVSEDESAFLKKVDDLHSNLKRLTPHQLLDLDESSDEETVKKNYYRLTRDFHPDRYFSAADPSVKDKLTSIFDALTNAYATLAGAKRPADSVSAADGQEKQIPSAGNGEKKFKQGVHEFRKGNFAGAVEFFRGATESDPKKPKYWSYLSLSLTKIPHGVKDAENALLEAIRLEPGNADHYANLGLIHLRQGMKEKASEQFSKALKLDPRNTKAKKGLEKTRR